MRNESEWTRIGPEDGHHEQPCFSPYYSMLTWYYNVTYLGVCVTYKRVLDWWPDFIAHLYNLLVHFTNHNMTHYVFSSSSSPTAITRDYHNSHSSSKVEVRVTLRLAVYRQSVRLGIKTLENHDQRFFQLNPCGNSPYVTPSLTRRCVCLGSAATENTFS
jgi:hypothetical protein